MGDYVYATTSDGGIFKYKNMGCECKVDKIHNSYGMPEYFLKVMALEDKVFTYRHYFGSGAVKVNTASNAKYSPISDLPISGELFDFVNRCESYNKSQERIPVLRKDKMSFERYAEEVASFFEKYGCLVPVPDEFVTFDMREVKNLLDRMYVLIGLIAAVSEAQRNYTKIFYYSMFLALKPQAVLNCKKENGECIYSISSVNPYYAENCGQIRIRDEKVKPIPATNLLDYPDAVIHGDIIATTDEYEEDGDFIKYVTSDEDYLYYPVTDYLEDDGARPVFLRKSAYLGYLDGKDLSASAAHLRINYLYVHSDASNRINKLLIDFIFHFHNEIMEIADLSNYNFEPIKLKEDINLNECASFDEKYKNTLLELARATIKSEIDHVVSVIHPVYNPEEMMPGWHIPDLFTAIYYGIFLNNSSQKIFKVCANPSCNRLFDVESSNYKKRYCDPSCQIAAAQRLYRRKHKQNNS